MVTTATPSGLGSSVGIASEGSSYGTFVAPVRSLEFESESIEWKPNRTAGKGLYNGGMFPRGTQRVTTTAAVDGDIVTPVYTKGMGYWLGLIFGTMGITPVQQAATAAYLQTHTFASNYNQSASIQIGRPTMSDGVINPYSYLGMKVTKAVFEAKINEPLRLTMSFDGKDVTEAQTYTAPTYQTANPALFFNQGLFQMGAFGSEATVEGVRSLTLTITRGQRVDGFYMDGTGRKTAPVPNAVVSVTGAIETDFLLKASFADVFYNDTPKSLIVPFTGALIASTYSYGLTLKLPQIRFDSEPPKVSGPDIIQPAMTFTAEYDDTNAPFTATYMSTDTTL